MIPLFKVRLQLTFFNYTKKLYDHCGVWVALLKLREGKGKRKNVKYCPSIYFPRTERCMLVVNLIACEWKCGSGTAPDCFVLFEKALNTDI